MYVIYDKPADWPNGFVVRVWIVSRAIVVPGPVLGSDVATLEEARALVPVGHVNIGRNPEDDPTIVEVWT